MIPAGVRSWQLQDLAAELGLEYRGEGSTELRDARDLASAGDGELAALYDRKQADAARESGASALVVKPALADDLAGKNLLLSPVPKADFARAVALLRPVPRPPAGVHPSAVLGADVVLGDEVSIGPGAVVGARCRIGARSVLGPGAVLLDDVTVGEDVEIHPRVVIYPHTEVGPRCALFAGAVIGAPGFGHAHDADGHALRVPHLGRVVLEEGVEVGANATIDRATFGETRLAARARIDNLVQIGHNARVGEDAMIAAQSGLSGSSSLGKGVVVGGQSGLADHVHVGDRSAVAAKTAVFQDVEPGKIVAGIPALPASLWRRIAAVNARLPQLWADLRKLKEKQEREE